MSARYPLWCVDRGDKCPGELQYLGPYVTEARATGASDADDLVRRCRRIMPSELGRAYVPLDNLIETLNEDACEGDLPDGAWADFEDSIVSADPPPLDAFKAWLDANLTVKAFICEGDEPEPGGEG